MVNKLNCQNGNFNVDITKMVIYTLNKITESVICGGDETEKS